jgi:membrane protease YdiL (CAAX protease family)
VAKAGTETSIGGYFEETGRPIYSIVAALPFFVAYELGVALLYNSQPDSGKVKNLAEVILHLPGHRLGTAVAYLLPALAGLAILVVQHRRETAAGKGRNAPARKFAGLRLDYLMLMAAEGLVLALPLGLLAREIPDMIRLQGLTGGRAGQFVYRLAMACGAGAYEELLFRLLLFSGLMALAHKAMHMEKPAAWLLAAATSSVVFALFHFVGPGRGFDLVFFVFATVAGMYLSAVCCFRSFGMAVVAHAFYDILVELVN